MNELFLVEVILLKLSQKNEVMNITGSIKTAN